MFLDNNKRFVVVDDFATLGKHLTLQYHYNSHIFHQISSFLTFSTKILTFHCFNDGFFISLHENKGKTLKIPF